MKKSFPAFRNGQGAASLVQLGKAKSNQIFPFLFPKCNDRNNANYRTILKNGIRQIGKLLAVISLFTANAVFISCYIRNDAAFSRL